MESIAKMNDKMKHMAESASCENNLRFCAENRRCLYEWMISEKDENIILVEEANLKDVLDKMQAGAKYDVIILDDVLSRLSSIEHSLSVEAFLGLCKNALNDRGKLIVSTANRIGMQYLSGKPDDYTGEYFDGINQYPFDESQKSYTKKELERILGQEVGFSFVKFFYPYPNQLYVKEVFAEGNFAKYQYGRPYINTVENKMSLFNVEKLANALVMEDVAESLANAFWIVASEEELEIIEDIDYVKLNWDREEKFQIATVIRNSGVAEKYALNENAQAHIRQLYTCGDMGQIPAVQNLRGEFKEKSVVYPLLKSQNLDELLVAELQKGNKETFFALFDKFYKKLFERTEHTDQYATEQFEAVFGRVSDVLPYHCVAPMNIDLICDNVFCQDDEYIIIDCEWIFDFLVPVEFVVWRAINELYSKHIVLERLIPKREFYTHYSITMQDEKNFMEWGIHFAYEYVKSDSVREKACKEVPVSLKKVYKEYLEKEISQGNISIPVQECFEFDMGNGFEKGNRICGEITQVGEQFKIELAVPKKAMGKLIKWNPAQYPCSIFLTKSEGFEIVGHNAYKVQEKEFEFLLGDAFFYFKMDKDCSEIVMEGQITQINVSEQRKQINQMSYENAEKEQMIEALKSEVEQLKSEYARVQDSLDSVLNSTIWRKTEFLRQIKDKKTVENIQDSSDNVTQEEVADTSGKIRELVRYCVDEVVLADGMMSIDGWILCENHAIDLSYLILEDVNGIRRQYPFKLSGRKDVAEALNVKFDGGCGIHIAGNYKSYCEQKIIFKIMVSDEWIEVDTGVSVPITDDSVGGEFYLERYGDSGEVLDYSDFKKNHMESLDVDTEGWKVDVVVPVYNGFQYLADLFTSMEKTKVDYRLILIEDCSPDEKVLPYLEQYAKEHNHVVLLKNSENMGFVKSVNRALRMVENHVALVNTDVIVPEGWLERLMAPIFNNAEIASVTPFTNSGTIFSFPDFAKDNSLFMGLSVAEIDTAFAKIKPRYVEAPTGVGFCMGMNKNVMQEIGVLDEETFEKGYGEENDWCQRAINAGYKNVYAENLFVHHNHGGSFPSETKQRLLRENAQKLAQKHPNYNADVAKFCRMDPNEDIREFIKFELMFHSDKTCILAFDHDLGGGASAYLKQKMEPELAADKLFVIVRYNLIAEQYFLSVYYGGHETKIMLQRRKDVVKLLKEREYAQIWINELATYVELEKWLSDLQSLREEKAQSMRLLLHDYFMVCPSLNLMSNEGKYCKIPKDMTQCAECLKGNEYTYYSECESLQYWRDAWGELMNKCDEIIAFSKDTVRIMNEVYPEIADIQLIPHVVEPLDKVKRKEKKTSTVNIGVLGAISEQKGLYVVKKMLQYIEEHGLNMKIVVIGECAEEVNSPAFSITGRYVRNDIPKLTVQHDIDAFLIPSIWPETFSYTTSEIMSMEMPIAVFNLGAPVERVEGYDKGLILGEPDMDIAELVHTLYKFAQSS